MFKLLKKKYKGSLTLEASVILPIFFIITVVAVIISIRPFKDAYDKWYCIVINGKEEVSLTNTSYFVTGMDYGYDAEIYTDPTSVIEKKEKDAVNHKYYENGISPSRAREIAGGK